MRADGRMTVDDWVYHWIGGGVLVACSREGRRPAVYAGRLVGAGDGFAVLDEPRQAVRWPSEERSFLWLAREGPGPRCRISRAGSRTVITGVGFWALVKTKAWAKWCEEPWG